MCVCVTSRISIIIGGLITIVDGRAVKKKLTAPALKQEPVVVAAVPVTPAPVASTAEDDDEDVDLLGLGMELGQTCVD